MSQSNRRDRFALIALGLALAAIVLVTWITNKPTSEQIRQPNAANLAQRENQPVQPSGFWDTYTHPEDTIAQWLMAVFSVVATGFSIRAVFLIRDTLHETRKATEATIKANSISELIGQRQIRAYLSVDSVVINIFGHAITVTPLIKNSGLSPAKNVVIKSDLIAMISGFNVGSTDFASFKGVGREVIEKMGIVPSSASVPTSISACNVVDLGMPDLKKIIFGRDPSAVIVSNGHIEWEDIFDERHSIDFSVISEGIRFLEFKMTGGGKVTHSEKSDQNKKK